MHHLILQHTNRVDPTRLLQDWIIAMEMAAYWDISHAPTANEE